IQMLPPELFQTIRDQEHAPLTQPSTLSRLSQEGECDTEEERHWRTFCEQHRGDVYAMANALGVHRTTIIRKLKKYGLSYARKPRARLTPPKTSVSFGR
ncbi:MAG: helix-turn-helix domain-containing protein, partial [Candidatus Binatia bacterium]